MKIRKNLKLLDPHLKDMVILKNVIGNWWNHDILRTDSQISPLSGSIKTQVVKFIG